MTKVSAILLQWGVPQILFFTKEVSVCPALLRNNIIKLRYKGVEQEFSTLS
jgi:hypothetical protein